MLMDTKISLFLILSVIPKGAFSHEPSKGRTKWNATYTDRLRHDLLQNYDRLSRPAHHSNTTTVNLGVSVNHVDINEAEATLNMNAFFTLQWTDEKLMWNATEYGNLSVVNFAPHEIWQPDIFIYNSATAQEMNNVGDTLLILSDDGDVKWVPPTQVKVLCNIDLQYWPLDIQICELTIASWTYDGDQVDVVINADGNDSDTSEQFFENSKWNISITLQRVVHMYLCCSEPYPFITMRLTMHRFAETYKTIVITPAFVIIFLILMPFCLPPQAGEKLIIQGCTAIIICILLLYFNQLLSAMGRSTPNIVLFYGYSLYIVSLSMMTSIGVIWLARTPHHHPLPWRVKQILIGPFGKCCLGLGHYIAQAKINRSNIEELHTRQENGTLEVDYNRGQDRVNKDDWMLLAAAIDRVSIVVYWIILAVMGYSFTL